MTYIVRMISISFHLQLTASCQLETLWFWGASSLSVFINRLDSGYPCIKYDRFLPSKIQRSLVLNSSVIEPNAFSFITVGSIVTTETVGFKPRWSLILEINFPLPVWALPANSKIGKTIPGEELNLMQRIDWSNASWTINCYY